MKRTVILLGILTLLVILTLNRWDIRNYGSDGKVQIRTDRLTMQTQVLFPAKDVYVSAVIPTKFKHNKYLVHGTTAILYSAMAATTVALFLEARKEEEGVRQ